MIIIFNFLISIVLCKDGYFEDINGTTSIYHGINLLHYPITNIKDNELETISKVGLNLIRLAIYFDQAVPTKPKQNQMEFNLTYLDQIQQIVKMAAKYEIDVILVGNQQYLNKQFCGFGFPDWIIKKITFPNPYLRYENKTLQEICHNLDVKFYRTEDVGINFENLYKNINNSTDYFGQFWQKIASIYKDETNIVGYDLLNNPSCGNHQTLINNCLWPGYSNRKLIMPFYQKVNSYIREVDKQKIVFYQGQDNDNYGSGFDDNISGDLYRNKECYSFRITYTADYFIQFASYINYYSIWLDYSIAKHAKVSTFLSEFEGTNEYLLNSLLQEADYLRTSWTYKGEIQQFLRLKPLQRAYAQKICAEEIYNHEYNADLGVFKLQYMSKNGCQTQLFIPFPFDYQCSNCSVKFKLNSIFEVKHLSKQIQLVIWHKQ